MILEDIKTYLESQGFPSVYISTQPSKKENSVTLTLANGSDCTSFFGSSQVLAYPTLRVIVRDDSSSNVLVTCEGLVSSLLKFHSATVDGMKQLGDIEPIGRTPLGDFEAVINCKLFVRR